jgi:hypothetical protein
LALLLPVSLALPAPAGIIFGKQKHKPTERVPQLIAAVKTETDESKRESAAKELRDYDAAAFPEIVPVLIDVLQHDAKAGVRAEAAGSLSKLRPVSQEAGWALEQALKDHSIRVRWQARTAILNYRLAGYRSEPTAAESPAAPARPANPAVARRVVIPPVPRTESVIASGETAPPPLAQPLPRTSTARPQPILTPSETPKLQKPPAAPSSDQGPDLPPQ